MNKYFPQIGLIPFFLLLFLTFLNTQKLRAADYYWVGGAGNWAELDHWATTSGGVVKHPQIPTANDNVLFDASSFNAPNQVVTVNVATAFCKNMTWTGVTNTPILRGPVTAIIVSYGSMTLVTGMRFEFLGDVTFQSSTTGNTLISAGQKFAKNLTFDNVTGELIFQDAINIDSSLVLKNGTLKTNGQAVNANRINANCGTSGTLDLGNSMITLRGGFLFLQGYNFYTFFIEPIRTKTVTGGSHVIECTSPVAWVRVGDYAYTGTINPTFINEVKFSAASGSSFLQNNSNSALTVGTARFASNGKFLTNSMTINNVFFASGKSYEFESGKTFSIGSLSATGSCTAAILLKSVDAGVPATLSSSSNIAVNYVTLKDIASAGGGSFTANNSVKIGITTGWNITEKTAQTLYWVAGNGNWDDVSHWSTASGGAGGACLPTAKDDVVFDQNSFTAAAQKANINVEDAFCKSMTWNSALSGSGMGGSSINNLHVYGSFTLNAMMDWQFGGKVHFEGDALNLDINTASKELLNDVLFNGDGGWILRGELRTKEAIRFNKGTWNTNDQYVRCKFFRSETKLKRDWKFGNSLIECYNVYTITNSWYLFADNLTLDAGRSELVSNNESGTAFIDGKGALTFYNLTFRSTIQALYTYRNEVDLKFNKVRYTSARTYMTGSMTIDTIIYIQNSDNTISDATYYSSEPFNSTIKVKVIQTAKGCNTTKAIIHKSSYSYASAFFSANTDSVVVENVIIQDIKAMGNMIVNNGRGVGNTTGWTIRKDVSRTLYWVGGSGDWFDPIHWSLTSGGAGGACIPTPEDDVFFNANSFTAANQSVFVTRAAGLSYGYLQNCRNMDWTGARFNPQFDFYNLFIYGNLKFIPEMIAPYSSYLTFMSDNPYTIQMEGIEPFSTTFSGRGIGTLNSQLKSQYLYVNHGGIITQSQPITVKYYFNIENSETDSLTVRFGNSLIRVTTGFPNSINSDGLYINSNYLNFDAGKSTIQIETLTGGFSYINKAPLSIYNLVFNNPAATSNRVYSFYTTLNYNKIHFYGNGEIWYNTLGDSLICSAGKTYSFGSTNTQTIRKYFQLIGNNCESIRLQSLQSGRKANVKMDGGVLLADFVQMSDQNAQGSLIFYAGSHSTNVGNSNTGWLFQGSPTYKEIGFLGIDTAFCNLIPFELKAYASSTATYVWSTGATTPSITINTPNEYRATVTFGNSCVIRDTIKIEQVITPVFDLGKDTVLCNNQTTTLNLPTIANATYSWQDGKTTPQYLVSQAGTYTGEITIRGCKTIDSVKVAYVSGASFSLGNDTTLCAGQVLNYNFSINGAIFKWQDGSTAPQYLVNKAGTYKLEVSTNACKIVDSVVIAYVDPGSFDLGKDTTLCEGQILTLKPILPNAAFRWQDGSTNQELTVQSSGLYKVIASVANCSATDSIQVGYKSNPKFELGNDTTLCNNDVLTLNAAAQTGSTYRWQNNTVAATFQVSTANLYKVIVNLNGCEKADSINITYTAPPVLELGNDTTLCESTTYVLKSNSNGDALRWQDGSTGSSLNVTKAGKYLLAASLKGCVRKDSVIINFTPVPRFDLGNDTTLCNNDVLTLNATAQTGATYRWQNNSTAATFRVSTANLYKVIVNLNGCEKTDSINIAYTAPPVLELGNDTTICESTTYVVKSNSNGDAFRWQDGTTGSSLNVTKAGKYLLAASLKGCVRKDSVIIGVTALPRFNLGNDTALCVGDSLRLSINIDPNNLIFLWQDASNKPTLTVNKTNKYTAQAARLGCIFTDEINVSFATPPQFSLGIDTLICDSEPYILSINVPNSTFLWSDSTKSNALAVTKTGDYWVQVKTKDGCLVSDSVSITTKKCPTFKPFIPNVFSPNDDAQNDEIKPFFQPDFPIKSYIFQIFTRWGNPVFTSVDMNQGWNGKIDGKVMSVDVYVYYIKVTYLNLKGQAKEAIIGGDFTLIR
jgi:gliding motility-associated-like protein